MPSDSWQKLNAHRAFPLTAASAAAGAGGAAGIPDSAILDCGFVIAPSGDLAATTPVRLSSVVRSGGSFTFTFKADTTILGAHPIVFTRSVGATTPVTSFADGGAYGCGESPWEGFLTTGDLTELAALMPSDGTRNGSSSTALVETACVQNLSGTRVTSFAVANLGRIPATAPAGCTGEDQVMPGYHVVQTCMVGSVRFVPGHNAIVQQSADNSTLTFGASPNRGTGFPCSEVPVYPSEPIPSPPAGSIYLDGALACSQTVRSISGVGGPAVVVKAGHGFSVVPVAPNILRITVSSTAINGAGGSASASSSLSCSDSLGVP